ncbi:hypothetical protein ACWGDS_31110 [Streptomyces sp. NPDC055059]
MKLTVQVKLLPTPVQAAALGAGLHACEALGLEFALTVDVGWMPDPTSW